MNTSLKIFLGLVGVVLFTHLLTNAIFGFEFQLGWFISFMTGVGAGLWARQLAEAPEKPNSTRD